MDQAMRPERDDSNWDRGQTSRNLHEAIHRFFTNVQGVEPVGSAAHLLRVVADGGNYVLREWAAGTAAAQVNLTQWSLQIAATAGAVSGVSAKSGRAALARWTNNSTAAY